MTQKQKAIISEIVKYLKATYGQDGTGHDWLHLERVWKMAKRLARGEKVDMFLVEMGALLHDVDDFKFRKPGRGEYDGVNALMDRFDLLDITKEQIRDITGNVSYKGALVPSVQRSMEGKIVQDADRLDAMGAIGIARTFVFNGSRGNPMYDPTQKPHLARTEEEYTKGWKAAITHFYEKLLLLKDKMNTLQARSIAEGRHKFLETYLEQFWAEIGGNR